MSLACTRSDEETPHGLPLYCQKPRQHLYALLFSSQLEGVLAPGGPAHQRAGDRVGVFEVQRNERISRSNLYALQEGDGESNSEVDATGDSQALVLLLVLWLGC